MDIIKELNLLPTYCYVYETDDGQFFALLGGQSDYGMNKCCDLEVLRHLHDKITMIYKKENLNKEDKIALAKLARKIHNACGKREEGRRTLKEQEILLQSLPNETLSEIEYQIQMYKNAREYYRIYLS